MTGPMTMNPAESHGDGAADDTGHGMTMRELPLGQAVIWIAMTFVILFAAIWLTDFIVPVRF